MHATLRQTRFTVDEFLKLVDADAFGTRRVELLNGRIYRMAAQGMPHILAVTRTNRAVSGVSTADEWVYNQATLRLDRHSAPDPDVVWLPCPEGTPMDRWPLPLLVIEVSDTTYRFDSGRKLRKYAKRGIADYWIENLNADRVEVCRDPRDPTGKLADCHYASVEHFARGQRIPVLLRPGVTLAVDDLLP